MGLSTISKMVDQRELVKLQTTTTYSAQADMRLLNRSEICELDRQIPYLFRNTVGSPKSFRVAT